jgi:hypothetical protein
LFAPAEISVDSVRVPQVKTQHKVNIREFKRVIRRDDLLGSSTIPKFMNDNFQQYPSFADPDRVPQGDALG